MKKLRTFSVQVTYRDAEGRVREEEFPVTVADYDTGKELAFRYTVEVLELRDFELRIVGS